MDNGQDSYLTVAREAEIQLKVRRSLFLARVRETPSPEASREFLREVTRRHGNATHNCWARRLGMFAPFDDNWSDDGEPAGTAGRPIHGAISRQSLSNVTLAVTRYFGGRKLGVRGLIETYGAAAQAVLKEAGIARRRLHRRLTVACAYAALGEIQGMLAAAQGYVAGADYGETVQLQLAVPVSQASTLVRQLQEKGLEVNAEAQE